MQRATKLALNRPRLVLGAWVGLVIGLSVLGSGVESRLTQSILALPGTESERAIELARERFGETVTAPVLLEGPSEAIDDQGPTLAATLSQRDDIRVLSPWDRGQGAEQLRPRPDAALIVAAIDRPYREAFDVVAPELREQVEAEVDPPVSARVTGMPAIGNGLKEESYSAARRAELIAIPILILVLLAVFRSPLAAGIPALAGLSTVGASFGGLWLLASVREIDPIATSLASMMGLALGVDYSLLMVSRFREELAAGVRPPQAAASAGGAAGRTVLFAGLALIAAMVVSLLVAPGDLLFSAASGVIVATALSIGAALLAMPAALLLAGSNIDRWRLGRGTAGRSRWVAGLERLLRRPGLAAAALLAPLLLLSAPALALDTGPPDVRQLPASSEARRDFEAVKQVMGPGWAAPFDVVVSSERGTITDPQRLESIGRWQREVSTLDGVSYVVGPGQIAEEAPLTRTADRRADRGYRALRRLRDGLRQADEAMTELRNGIAQGAQAAEAISAGAARASEETGELSGALQAPGAGKLAAALSRAERGAARLEGGAAEAADASLRLAEATAEAAGQAESRLVPGASALAEGLRKGVDDLGRLREPARIAEREADKALAALKAMSVGKADPQYLAALQATARAYGAISGRDPVTGLPTDPRYRGLDAELAGGQAKLAEAADGAARLASGTETLAAGLGRLAEGSGKLSGGLGRLGEGAARLEEGLARLADAGRDFDERAAQLAAGADRLIAGLDRLERGTGRLAAGLGEGHERSGRLETGLGQLAAGSARIYAGASSARQLQRRRSPGLLDSGYLTLAALEGARRRDREGAQFAVNVERGGQAGAIMVIPESGPNDPRTAELRDTLSERADDLAEETGAATAVGGPAAQLADYDRETSSRLPLLILALALVTYLVLVPIFRSLLLPAVAVALNLITVAATFGALAFLFEGETPLLGGPGYVDAVAISAIYTVIFGLSLDYEVFLITRMREGWLRSGDTGQAVAYGLERTASVVTGAAAIMTGVFLAFALTEVANTRQFGVGLAIAVILDATVVRLVLLPACMRLLGDRCWSLPASLERRLPRLDAEPAPEGARRA